jgi:hypothetical protein
MKGPRSERGKMCDVIYRRAVEELFRDTYGRLEDRDRIKVVQLFDRLWARGFRIHVDDLRRICRQAGYREDTADEIGRLYDDLVLIREELENPQTLDCWPPERIERVVSAANAANM